MEGVIYRSAWGVFNPLPGELLWASGEYISLQDGPNDGLVPVTSAKHGELIGEWPGSHFRLVNWGNDILLNPLEFLDGTVARNYRAMMGALVGRERWPR